MWTPEKTAELIQMVLDGKNIKLITMHFGAEKPAIASKIARLRKSGALPKPVKPVKEPNTTKARKVSKPKATTPEQPPEGESAPTPPKTRKTKPAIIEDDDEDEPAKAKPLRTLELLGSRDSRWPVGDPKAADFKFCGKKIEADQHGPYCREHYKVAFSAYSRHGAVAAAE